LFRLKRLSAKQAPTQIACKHATAWPSSSRLQLQKSGRSAYLILPAKSEEVVTFVR
jgi:hypothetical protein